MNNKHQKLKKYGSNNYWDWTAREDELVEFIDKNYIEVDKVIEKTERWAMIAEIVDEPVSKWVMESKVEYFREKYNKNKTKEAEESLNKTKITKDQIERVKGVIREEIKDLAFSKDEEDHRKRIELLNIFNKLVEMWCNSVTGEVEVKDYNRDKPIG